MHAIWAASRLPTMTTPPALIIAAIVAVSAAAIQILPVTARSRSPPATTVPSRTRSTPANVTPASLRSCISSSSMYLFARSPTDTMPFSCPSAVTTGTDLTPCCFSTRPSSCSVSSPLTVTFTGCITSRARG